MKFSDLSELDKTKISTWEGKLLESMSKDELMITLCRVGETGLSDRRETQNMIKDIL